MLRNDESMNIGYRLRNSMSDRSDLSGVSDFSNEQRNRLHFTLIVFE